MKRSTLTLDKRIMKSAKRLSLALQLIACVTHAKIDWNLESTFLMHL